METPTLTSLGNVIHRWSHTIIVWAFRWFRCIFNFFFESYWACIDIFFFLPPMQSRLVLQKQNILLNLVKVEKEYDIKICRKFDLSILPQLSKLKCGNCHENGPQMLPILSSFIVLGNNTILSYQKKYYNIILALLILSS